MKMKQEKRRFGLKRKFLFRVLAPVLLTFIVIGVYSTISMNRFGKNIRTEATSIVTDIAEQMILEKARSVSREFAVAMRMWPDLTSDAFNKNKLIQDIAVQKVGQTGYTCLYEVPNQATKTSALWVHPNGKLIGKDTPSLMKKPLGDRYDDWFTIYKGAYQGKESFGYYLWEDADGKLREKYMACVPVADTPFVIAATTYLDEFLTPVKKVENRISDQVSNMRLINSATMVIGLLLLIGVVIYSIQKLTLQIVKLTSAISNVSMGKVDDEIEIVQSNDELQDLSEAFERMRTGVKFIMQKLEDTKAKTS
jgi:HAMP domain-containing protein